MAKQKTGKTKYDKATMAAYGMGEGPGEHAHTMPVSQSGRSKSGGATPKQGSVKPTKMHGSR